MIKMDIPILTAIHQCTKLGWRLHRHWKSRYIDLDLHDIYDENEKKIYANLSHNEMISIVDNYYKANER